MKRKKEAPPAGRCEGCGKGGELKSLELCEACADKLFVGLWLDAFGYTSEPL